MKISVIISNFNGARFLPRLLETLFVQTGVETEIIMVDRQSRDESHEIFRRFPALKITEEPPETGLVSGYHRGAVMAAGEAFFFCNEDMRFEPDCLAKLIAHINLTRRIGIVDPWQWTYDGGELIHAGTGFKRTKWDLNSPCPSRSIAFLEPLQSGEIIPLPCAGALLIHRGVYEEIGGWDTTFFLNDEDTDLALRAWQYGWKTVTAPEARVYHAVGSANVKIIPHLAQSVSQRRYICTFANKAIIAVKYFRKNFLIIIILSWIIRFLNNLRRGRWNFIKWDFFVIREISQRWPEAMRFRKENHEQFPEKPGELFFKEPAFQAGFRGI